MCIFLHGFKLEIQAKLKVSQFRSLTALMDKVLDLEDQNLAWKEGGKRHFPRGGGTFQGPTLPRAPGVTKAVLGTSSSAYI